MRKETTPAKVSRLLTLRYTLFVMSLGDELMNEESTIRVLGRTCRRREGECTTTS